MDEEIKLVELRGQIENLLKSRAQALAENKLLSEKLIKGTKERALLLKKNDNVVEKLKTIIKRLKQEMT